MASCYDHTLYLHTVGGEDTGKTSIITVYDKGAFPDKLSRTDNVDITPHTVMLDGMCINQYLWDTVRAGHRATCTLSQVDKVRNAEGFLCVYSITDANSFEVAKSWVSHIQRQERFVGVPIILVGNKCDCDPECRQVERETAQQYADTVKLPFMEISAKVKATVDPVFTMLTREAIQRQLALRAAAPAAPVQLALSHSSSHHSPVSSMSINVARTVLLKGFDESFAVVRGGDLLAGQDGQQAQGRQGRPGEGMRLVVSVSESNPGSPTSSLTAAVDVRRGHGASDSFTVRLDDSGHNNYSNRRQEQKKCNIC